MTLAINDTGDVLSDASGTWAPATRAVNDQTGDMLALDSGAWRPLPRPQTAADTDQDAANTPGPSIASEAAHGFGLGVRNVAEGIAGSLPGMAIDAATYPTRALLRAVGVPTDAPSTMVSKGLTAAGIPEPETSGEHLRGAAISGMASTLPTMGLGQIAALAEKSPAIAKAFAEGIIGQLTGGAAAGTASEGTRQLGGGPIAQTAAGMAGGLVGGAAGTMATPHEAPTSTSSPQFVSERFAPDVSGLDPRNAITALIQHDITENTPSVADIGKAPDVDTAIAVADKVAKVPAYAMVTAPQVAARDNIPIMQAWDRARTENDAGMPGGGATVSPMPQTRAEWDAAHGMQGGIGSDAVTPPAEAQPGTALATIPSLAPVAEAPPDLATAIRNRDFTGAYTATKKIASGIYQKAADVGGVLTPDFANRVMDEMDTMAPSEAKQAVTGDQTITNLVQRMRQQFGDKPLTLEDAQGIDEGLGEVIDKEFGLTGLSKQGQQVLDFQTTFRNMIKNAAPEDVQGGMDGFNALNQGRAVWAQAMKMGDIARLMQRSQGSDNPATAIKTYANTLLNSVRSRGYNGVEKAALQQMTQRGALGSALHVFGSRLIPYVAGAVGEVVGGPVGAIAGAAMGHAGSTVMRNAATVLQTSRAGNLLDVLGQGVPQGAPVAP